MYGTEDGQARASFNMIMNNIRKIEKQVLVYDTTDMIGAIGGPLGLFLGFSFFDVISKCLDNLIMRLVNYFVSSKVTKDKVSPYAPSNDSQFDSNASLK